MKQGCLKIGWVLMFLGSTAHAGVQYAHSDHLGSTNSATDASGTVQQIETYTPFGERVFEKAPTVLSMSSLYTGQELDRESDLYNYGARYYDPATAKFLSVDPVFDSPNRYSYVANNPLSRNDPTGELFWDVVDVAVFVVNYKAYQDNPSGENLFWLVVSGAGLFPVLPSGGYFSPAIAEEVAVASETVVRASQVAARTRAGIESGIFLSKNSEEGEGDKRPADLSQWRHKAIIKQAEQGNYDAMRHGASIDSWRERFLKMSAAEKREEFHRIDWMAEKLGLRDQILKYANQHREFMRLPTRTEMSAFDLPELLNEAVEGTQLDIRSALSQRQLPPREVNEFLKNLDGLL